MSKAVGDTHRVPVLSLCEAPKRNAQRSFHWALGAHLDVDKHLKKPIEGLDEYTRQAARS